MFHKSLHVVANLAKIPKYCANSWQVAGPHPIQEQIWYYNKYINMHEYLIDLPLSTATIFLFSGDWVFLACGRRLPFQDSCGRGLVRRRGNCPAYQQGLGRSCPRAPDSIEPQTPGHQPACHLGDSKLFRPTVPLSSFISSSIPYFLGIRTLTQGHPDKLKVVALY